MRALWCLALVACGSDGTFDANLDVYRDGKLTVRVGRTVGTLSVALTPPGTWPTSHCPVLSTDITATLDGADAKQISGGFVQLNDGQPSWCYSEADITWEIGPTADATSRILLSD